MRSRWGRLGLLGPLLALCGVAVLLVAAQQRPSTPSPSATTLSIPEISAGPAQAKATPGTAQENHVNDDLVSSAPWGTDAPATSATPAAPPPTRLRIPSIGIDQPIVEVQAQVETVSGQEVLIWNVADYAVGHNDASAEPGEGGNVVLAGHDDWQGEVFRDLHTIEHGAAITVTTADGKAHGYVVTDILYRQEVGVSLSERLKTGELIGPTTDEHLTLVTCWPYGIDDHRPIVIARPAP
jgi:sortase A